MKLSIITVNLNNRDGLQRTIDSVVSQTFKDFEWIVIDGGSTDGSKELIEQYADRFAYWVSEPDKGIYNAMNKGIKVAKGEYLLFLNSGDWIIDERVAQDFIETSISADIISGDVCLVYDENTMPIKKSPSPEDVGFDYFFHGGLCHQSTFINKKLFDRFGLYEEQFRIVSDWEFFMKVVTVFGASYGRFNRVVSCFPVDGISGNPAFEQENLKNRREAYLKFVPNSFLDAYERLDNEVRQLREEQRKYENLRDGRLGFLVRLAYRLKRLYNKH